jgi:hypothetical protein
MARRYVLHSIALAFGAMALLTIGSSLPARAQDPSQWREIETKYIFGFTTGHTIGLEGEREFSIDTVGRFGKSAGRFATTETKFEFEHTPTQFFQFEIGVLGSSYYIKDVPGLDDRRSINFGGLFGELRFLVIGRAPGQPFGLTLSVEPEWRVRDETSGEQIRGFGLEFKINADVEIVPNRLFAGFNVIYEPERNHFLASGEIEEEATLGFTAAIAYRPIAPLLVGFEVGYYRHYDALGLNNFAGDALFVGPTLYYQISSKCFVTAAWGTQIWGSQVGEPGQLNLEDFSRHRGKLKLAVEF